MQRGSLDELSAIKLHVITPLLIAEPRVWHLFRAGDLGRPAATARWETKRGK